MQCVCPCVWKKHAKVQMEEVDLESGPDDKDNCPCCWQCCGGWCGGTEMSPAGKEMLQLATKGIGIGSAKVQPHWRVWLDVSQQRPAV